MKTTYFKTVLETKIVIGVIKTGGGWNLHEKDEYITIPKDQFLSINAHPTIDSRMVPNISYVSLFYLNKEYRVHYNVIGRLVSMGFVVQCKGLNFSQLTQVIILNTFSLEKIEVHCGQKSSGENIIFTKGTIMQVLYPKKHNCMLFYNNSKRLVSISVLFHLLKEEYIIC